MADTSGAEATIKMPDVARIDAFVALTRAEPLRLGRIVVIGGGCYGSWYTQQLTRATQRGALIAQKVLDYRDDADYKNVLMYFQRTSTEDAKGVGKTDDKAIIKSIAEKALPVHFASALDQAKINDLKNDPTSNPFKAAYRVDVNVEVDRKGVPRFYRVVHLHEIMPEDEDDDDA